MRTTKTRTKKKSAPKIDPNAVAKQLKSLDDTLRSLGSFVDGVQSVLKKFHDEKHDPAQVAHNQALRTAAALTWLVSNRNFLTWLLDKIPAIGIAENELIGAIHDVAWNCGHSLEFSECRLGVIPRLLSLRLISKESGLSMAIYRKAL